MIVYNMPLGETVERNWTVSFPSHCTIALQILSLLKCHSNVNLFNQYLLI